MQALILLAFIVSPLIGLVSGFYAGRIKSALVRSAVAVVVVLMPLALVLWPLLLPWSSESQRYGAGMGLVMFGLPLALWTLFAALGIFVASARRRGPE